MRAVSKRLRWVGIWLATACGPALWSQTPIGSVSMADADVNGASSIANDRAELAGNSTVTAKDHVAYVQLVRGGSVSVCATSGVHLTAGIPAAQSSEAIATAPGTPMPSGLPPLMVALDRGALELHTDAIASDVVMTPDLHIGFSEGGPLDLRIRVTRNGDTCVENRVTGLTTHPSLHVGSLFGSDSYDVLPGQHVLFEGGNLHEVVDNETSPCGCPAPVLPAPVGEISLTGGDKTPTPSQKAEVQHPFPAAVSQGLAPPPPVPQAPPGVVHAQVATTLVYPDPADKPVQPPAGEAAVAVQTPTPPAAKKRGFGHSIGHFFKRLFD